MAGFESQYPYSDFHELNADYILKRLREIEVKLADYQTLINEAVDTKMQPYIEQLNTYAGQVNALSQQVDALDANVTARLNTFQSVMNTKFAQQDANIEQRFNTILVNLDRELAQIELRVVNMQTAFENRVYTEMGNRFYNMQQQLNTMSHRIDYILEAVQDELAEFLADLPESFYVISPFTGQLVTTQEAINELYDNATRYRAITAQGFDNLGLTAQAFDDLELTAWEFDTDGLDVLPVLDTKHNMFSPFTGEWVPLQTVIDGLATLHRLYSLTATELDALDLTASQYDGYDYTAFEFDWNSQRILV